MVENLDTHMPIRQCYVCGKQGTDLLRITVEKYRCSDCYPGSANWSEYKGGINAKKNILASD